MHFSYKSDVFSDGDELIFRYFWLLFDLFSDFGHSSPLPPFFFPCRDSTKIIKAEQVCAEPDKKDL
jgi:hypothetical protein